MTVNDKFQIGSVSKQFAAAALLKLQDEGKISADDNVTKYLPELINFKNIKIKNILNHTSGIVNYTDQDSFWELVDYTKVLSIDNIMDYIRELTTEFSSGEKYKYSNSNYIIAGKIIEKITGLTWDQYIKDNFLMPLQMNNSGYSPYFNKISDVVGYVKPEGEFIAVEGLNMSWALSAGALYSTADDLLKWTSIYDASEILSESAKSQMQTPYLGNYGYGVIVIPYGVDTLISHGGRTPGFVTSVNYLKNQKISVIQLDSTDGSVEAAALALDFFVLGKANALKMNAYKMDAKILADYVGVYKASKLSFNVFIKEGNLYLQPDDGQPAHRLTANDVDSFRLLTIAGEEFVRDQSGQVVELRHYQNNQVSIFKKVAPTN